MEDIKKQNNTVNNFINVSFKIYRDNLPSQRLDHKRDIKLESTYALSMFEFIENRNK